MTKGILIKMKKIIFTIYNIGSKINVIRRDNTKIRSIKDGK